ncbi:TIGR03086 family metal-binding protein [Nonomuraea lactucae]|uniref:TIGR03086 family metal-binding protein n=1 Tax=Nonomuraea lactucae TaxID=2249762 RepID=UPI0013B439C4|nr:TIGR03086 family metal-binding protein [Nonomuraea lactucae]
MDEMMPQMARAAHRTADLVEGVREEQLSLPTPCAEFDVRALIGHLEWVASLFESLAGGGPMIPQAEYTGDFRPRAERMLAAWQRPEAWEGVSPGMGLPMTTLAGMCLCDMIAHGWDLAVATGQPYEVGEDEAARLLEFGEGMAPTGRKMGAFGEEVAVSGDAPVLHRALGVIGRDPAWKP